jgi:ABC-type multidrug transport system fused ATPase/permease subunit
MSYHNNMSPGELIERIDGDVTELSAFFSQLVIRVLGNIVLLFGILAAMLFEDWRVGLAFTIFSAFTLYALNLVRGIAVPHQKKMREAIADLFGYLEERLSGTEDIRSSGAVDFAILGIYRLSKRVLGHWMDAQRRFVVVRLVAGLLLTSGITLSFVAGYNLYREGIITVGTVYLFIFYTNLLRRPIRELTQRWKIAEHRCGYRTLGGFTGHAEQKFDGRCSHPGGTACPGLRKCSLFLYRRRTRLARD